MTRARPVVAGLALTLVLLLCARSAAWAQSPSTPAPDTGQASSGSSRWHLTFRLGGGSAGTPTRGVASIPPPGLPVNLLPGFSTRRVPSWFFGDGTSLFNARAVGGQTITPLDPVIGATATSRSSGVSFGVTASRRLSSRFRVDVSIDASRIAPTWSAASRATIEAARASFTAAFGAVLDPTITGLTGVSVSSVASVTNGGGLEWMATGAVEVILRERGRTTWYSTVGAGLVGDTGDGPTATLTGHYAFTFGIAPYDQTDAVVVHAAPSRRRFTGMVGGGWRHDLGARWAIDANLRVGISQSGLTTRVDATPGGVLVDPSRSFVLGLGPSPAISFDNSSQTAGGLSSLKGPLAAVQTFVTTGPQIRVLASLGLAMRF